MFWWKAFEKVHLTARGGGGSGAGERGWVENERIAPAALPFWVAVRVVRRRVACIMKSFCPVVTATACSSPQSAFNAPGKCIILHAEKMPKAGKGDTLKRIPCSTMHQHNLLILLACCFHFSQCMHPCAANICARHQLVKLSCFPLVELQ